MNINIARKTLGVVIIFAGLLVLRAGSVYAQALPPANFPNGPQIPELPPCAMCDDFAFESDPVTATPEPTVIADPTPAPQTENNSDDDQQEETNSDSDSSNESSDEQEQPIGGQVLALSDTSGDDINFVAMILSGLVLVSAGRRLYAYKGKTR